MSTTPFTKELEALGTVWRALATVDPQARDRIMAFVRDRRLQWERETRETEAEQP